MPKVERGRISGFHGMSSHTASELFAWADRLEAQISIGGGGDDPKWLRRWADRLRRLAIQKERAQVHKQRQK